MVIFLFAPSTQNTPGIDASRGRSGLTLDSGLNIGGFGDSPVPVSDVKFPELLLELEEPEEELDEPDELLEDEPEEPDELLLDDELLEVGLMQVAAPT